MEVLQNPSFHLVCDHYEARNVGQKTAVCLKIMYSKYSPQFSFDVTIYYLDENQEKFFFSGVKYD